MAEDTSADLTNQAIHAALQCRWEEAVECNKKLLGDDPNDIDSLNRLAKAYFELNQINEAKKIYNQVLEADPYNTIAQKNLKRVNSFKQGDGVHKRNNSIISPTSFLHEPGVTKLINLVKVAEPQRLLKLSAGESVNLIMKNRGITITDFSNLYLGVLPDDMGHYLMKLLKGGNKYQAIIKSVKANGITILVRELSRSKKFKNQASFLDETRILTYSSDHISLPMDDQPVDAEDGALTEDSLS